MFKDHKKTLNKKIMKNNSWIMLIVFLAAGTALNGSDANKQESSEEDSESGPAYSFNNAKSTLYWEGARPGKMHYGTIEVINGTARTDDDRIIGGSFEIDMFSIQNTDISSESMKAKLLEYLKSEDFFYVEKFPKAAFDITRVEQTSGSNHMVIGNLTIRGNTHEISFPAEITMDDRMIHVNTDKISLERTRWDVNHMSKSVFGGMKDKFIDDLMVVKLDVHLSRD